MRPIILKTWPILCLICLLALPAMPASGAQGSPEGLPRIDSTALGTSVDLRIEEPVSVRSIYHAIATEAGIEVSFDLRLRDQQLTVDLAGLDLRTALDRTCRAAGHFWVPTDAMGILVADDTPQNRRTYEPQVIRTFDVEHVQLSDLMTVLRSVISLKSIAVDESGHTLTMRDTAAKVAIAGRIIDRLDRPRNQIVLDLELLRAPRADVDSLRGERAGELLRLTNAEHRELRATASILAQPTLSVIEGEPASYRLSEPIAFGTGAARDFSLELRFDARPHNSDESLTLRVSADARLTGGEQPASSRAAQAALRTASEDIVAFFDWLPLGHSDSDHVAVLIVRPRLIPGSAESGSLHAGFFVGTESDIRAPRSE